MKDYNFYLENYKPNKIKKNFQLNEGNQYIFHHHDSFQNYINILDLLNQSSPSNMKYSRKIDIVVQNSNYSFNTSDIHVEIDFELLGVNETNVILELMHHMKENMSYSHFYILCLHYEKVKSELCKLFKSFIHIENVSFILSTRNISQLDESFIRDYNIKIYGNTKYTEYQDIISDTSTNAEILCVCVKSIIDYIVNKKNNLFQLRELIYKIFILNINVHEAMCKLFEDLTTIGYINDKNIDKIMMNYLHAIEKYNNNYRSIFHIEYFIISLININK